MSNLTESNLSKIDIPTKTYQATKKSALKPTKKKDITILLVGEANGDKPSLTSLLIDLFLGNEALELTDRLVQSAAPGADKEHSQTTEVTLHKVTTLDGAVVQIFNTQDFGTKEDGSNVAKIRSALQAHVKSIDSVIIVADGLTSHLTPTSLNTINEFFPRSIIDNVGLVFANSGRLGWKFEMNSLPIELRKAKYWLLQNPLLALKDYHRIKKEYPDDEEAIQEALDELKDHYTRAVKALDGWLEWVDLRNTQRADDMYEPYDFAAKVKPHIEHIVSDATRLGKLGDDLSRIEWDLKKAEEDLERWKYSFSTGTKIPVPIFDHPLPVSTISGEVIRLRNERDSTKQEFEMVKGTIETSQADIRRHVDDFYGMAFSQSFAAHVSSAIHVLEDRKLELGSKPYTEVERRIIDKTIEIFKEKLPVVGEE